MYTKLEIDFINTITGKFSNKKQALKNIDSRQQNISEYIEEPNYKFNNQDKNDNRIDSIQNDWQDDTYVDW